MKLLRFLGTIIPFDLKIYFSLVREKKKELLKLAHAGVLLTPDSITFPYLIA